MAFMMPQPMSETYAVALFLAVAVTLVAFFCLFPSELSVSVLFPVLVAWAYLQRRVAGGPAAEGSRGGISLKGKVAIVTGANSGIGFYTALRLAELGCKVIITCRTQQLVKETSKRMRDEFRVRSHHAVEKGCAVLPSLDIEEGFTLTCDDFSSVRAFVDMFTAARLPCHILVNNAGMMVKPLTYSEKEPMFELHTAVNFFGPVLLTELLLPIIRRSNGRIVNVASEAHRFPEAFGSPQELLSPGYLLSALKSVNAGPSSAKGPLSTTGVKDAFSRYGVSKCCNVYYSHYIANKHPGVPVCSLHPGCVATGFTKNLLHPAIKAVYDKVFLLFLKTMEEGAETTIHCCTCDEQLLAPKAAVSGELKMAPYFVDCHDATYTLLRPVGRNLEAAMAISEWAVRTTSTLGL